MDNVKEAISYLSQQIVEVKAQAISARIVSGLIIDWLVQLEEDPKAILNELSAAVDRACDGLVFTPDGMGDQNSDDVQDEKVRELTRTFALQLLQNAYRRHGD